MSAFAVSSANMLTFVHRNPLRPKVVLSPHKRQSDNVISFSHALWILAGASSGCSAASGDQAFVLYPPRM
jgi:hypothetical protein